MSKQKYSTASKQVDRPGINRNNPHPDRRDSISLDNTTGFPTPPLLPKPHNDGDEHSIRRVIELYKLQSFARELLPNRENNKPERVCFCHRAIIPAADMVDVKKGQRRAYYANLFCCGSLWLCPVCASKMTERRRRELTEALANSPYKPILVTVTLSHVSTDLLWNLIRAACDAWGKVIAGSPWKRVSTRIGYVGSIRALECTHGRNGWHVHLHILVLVNQCDDLAAKRDILRDHVVRVWIKQVDQRGYYASEKFQDVRIGDDTVGRYVAKWSLEHEVTKSPAKIARKGGSTPFALLDKAGQGDRRAKALFLEYARAFRGQRQLRWSPGLRARLGLVAVEPSDDTLAQDVVEPGDLLLAQLDGEQWRTILKAGLRGELLAAAYKGADVLTAWMTDHGLPVGTVKHFQIDQNTYEFQERI